MSESLIERCKDFTQTCLDLLADATTLENINQHIQTLQFYLKEVRFMLYLDEHEDSYTEEMAKLNEMDFKVNSSIDI